jgi:uroporphyrinogen III methyltransferase/synthase
MSEPPRVYLVGAGPGCPGLLTLRAVECLRQADLVLYDRLVPPALLAFAPQARHVCVTAFAEHHVDRAPRVNDALVEAARAGQAVVRLKSGDPYVFGRGGEEAELLHQAGIPFEVVPGVTAALGAAAYAGVPLTHRQHASAVALITGHEDPAKDSSALDWDALARFPGTLAFYMGVARLDRIAESLVRHGKPADTPVAVVSRATTGAQRTVTATLATLASAAAAAGVTAPAVTLVGPVVGLRDACNWFERRPLFGQGVLVTRPRDQAQPLLRRLEALGATPYLLPTVEVREVADTAAVDRALGQLGAYDWLVFTSVNGVHAFVRRLRAVGRDLRALGTVQLAAIGPSTAEALRAYHLEPDLVPPDRDFTSEALAAALRPRVAGQRVLLARADRGRELLRDELSAVARVDQVAVYSQVDAERADPEVLAALRGGAIRYVTLTSSNIARSLARLVDEEARRQLRSGALRVVTISRVTSEAVRALGWPVAAEAREATEDGVVEALVALAGAE